MHSLQKKSPQINVYFSWISPKQIAQWSIFILSWTIACVFLSDFLILNGILNFKFFEKPKLRKIEKCFGFNFSISFDIKKSELLFNIFFMSLIDIFLWLSCWKFIFILSSLIWWDLNFWIDTIFFSLIFSSPNFKFTSKFKSFELVLSSNVIEEKSSNLNLFISSLFFKILFSLLRMPLLLLIFCLIILWFILKSIYNSVSLFIFDSKLFLLLLLWLIFSLSKEWTNLLINFSFLFFAFFNLIFLFFI